MYQNFNNFEARVSRTLRRYPILAIVGLALTVMMIVIIGKPVGAYVVNAFQRDGYHEAFKGMEGTAEAQQVWAELLSELKAIGDMGWMGKLIVSVPPIVRIAIYVLAMLLLGLGGYFLVNLWEASLDFGFWDKALTGIMYILYGLYMIVKAVVIFTAIVVVRTYYCARRVYRKGRKAYRRWKRQQKAANTSPRRE